METAVEAMVAQQRTAAAEEYGAGALQAGRRPAIPGGAQVAEQAEPLGCGRHAAAELLAREAQAEAERYLAMAETEALLLRASSARRRVGWTVGALGRAAPRRRGKV